MLNILAVDDERGPLRSSQRVILEALPDCNLAGFTLAREALAYAETTTVDIAFLDIDMAGMSGLVLAKHLKDINRKTNIVFVTGHSKYAVDAFAIPASGYLMKPVAPQDICRAMDMLRHPVAAQSTARVQVRCFGGFAVYVNGRPLVFPQAKVQELLAYLVHKRGSTVRNADIAAILWEDKPYNTSLQTQVRRARAQLMKILRGAGIEDIIKKEWNSIAVDVSRFACDSYDYLDGKLASVNAYTGEYMNEYSWAEFTAAYITEQMK